MKEWKIKGKTMLVVILEINATNKHHIAFSCMNDVTHRLKINTVDSEHYGRSDEEQRKARANVCNIWRDLFGGNN